MDIGLMILGYIFKLNWSSFILEIVELGFFLACFGDVLELYPSLPTPQHQRAMQS